MTDTEHHRRRADELLRRASKADNMAERSRLIDEAVRCSALADPEPQLEFDADLLLQDEEPHRRSSASESSSSEMDAR